MRLLASKANCASSSGWFQMGCLLVGIGGHVGLNFWER